MRQAIFFLCLWSCSLLAGHAQEADEANYDESKIPPYTLPALLKTSDGREITTVQQWEQIRRPELLSVFTEQVVFVFWQLGRREPRHAGGQGGCVLQEAGRQPQCGQRQRHPQTDRNNIQP